MIRNRTGQPWFRADPAMLLAERLIACLGLKGAMRACRENQWYGVQSIIEQGLIGRRDT